MEQKKIAERLQYLTNVAYLLPKYAHYKIIINENTIPSLGDCPFRNNCQNMDFCNYVHYALDFEVRYN